MSHLDPYHLAQLAQHYWSGQPHGPAQRIEPIMGGPENIREDPARARSGKSRGLDIFQMPQPPTTQAQKKAAAREQTAHDEGIKAVGDALRPGAIEPDASEAPTQALGAEAVDSGLDKELTRQWIDRMRAARESKKAKPPDKPPPGKGPPSWYDPQEHEQQGLGPDPLAQVGEDAVAKALRDIDMKPLIDHALMIQEAMRRRDAIRQMIESMQTPQLPESQIPENTNRPPGMEHSEVTAHDYSLLPPLAPGVTGIGMPPLSYPPMPPTRNENQPSSFPVDEHGNPLDAHGNIIPGGMPVDEIGRPLFPPAAPHDPNLPPGPHVRSPGKPEDEPPVVE